MTLTDIRTPAAPDSDGPDDTFDTTTIAASLAPVSRFTLADLAVRGPWLLGRLREFWPALFNERSLANRLSVFVGSNVHLLVKTDHGVSLAALTYDALDPTPVVQEVFVFLEDATKWRNARVFYQEMARWGRTHGAREVRPGYCSDLTPTQIKACVGEVKTRAELYWDIR